MTEATPPPASMKRIIGLVLITIGILWTAASGLCSAAFAVTLFTEGGGDFREALSIIPMVVLVGGFSAGLGPESRRPPEQRAVFRAKPWR